MAVYFMCGYTPPGEDAWFRKEWAKSGKKLDMGKSCVHFRAADDLPLDVIGEVVALTPADAFIASYEKGRARTDAGKAGTATRTATAAKARKAAKAGKAATTIST